MERSINIKVQRIDCNHKKIRFGEIQEYEGDCAREMKANLKRYNEYLDRRYAEDQRWFNATEWEKFTITIKNIAKKIFRRK